jgi:hypothetical protein
MPRFTVLEHDWPMLHWDLFLEAGTVLRAWRLLTEPAPGRSVSVEVGANHRLLYLDYEGPVSGGRGSVRRLDAGSFTWVTDGTERVEVELRGTLFNGRCVISPDAAGRLYAAFG